jgi:hypothetical protein
MAYRKKYSIISKLPYFYPSINACTQNFSSIGARKYKAYTYETNYENNHGRVVDSLESLLRHYTQLSTLEIIDTDSDLPHLYNMATRSLMLIVRYYRDFWQLGNNVRRSHEENLIHFNDQILHLTDKTQHHFLQSIWLPPELYISILKCPEDYISFIINQIFRDRDEQYMRLQYVFERLHSCLFTLLMNYAMNIEPYPNDLDLYNDVTLPDQLFYDISILIYCLDKYNDHNFVISHYPRDTIRNN